MDHIDVWVPRRDVDALDRVGAEPDEADLALGLGLEQRIERRPPLLAGQQAPGAVAEHDVNGVTPKLAPGHLDVLPRGRAIGPSVGLGRHGDRALPAAQALGHVFVGTVGRGRIDEADAALDRRPHDASALIGRQAALKRAHGQRAQA